MILEMHNRESSWKFLCIFFSITFPVYASGTSCETMSFKNLLSLFYDKIIFTPRFLVIKMLARAWNVWEAALSPNSVSPSLISAWDAKLQNVYFAQIHQWFAKTRWEKTCPLFSSDRVCLCFMWRATKSDVRRVTKWYFSQTRDR